MFERKITRPVHVGDVTIGGGAQIVIQSMNNTDTRDVKATLRQIDQLDPAPGLPRKVHAQVGFVHRRDRMTRHRGMAIEPVHDAVGGGGEQVAEHLEAPQPRRADHHRRP